MGPTVHHAGGEAGAGCDDGQQKSDQRSPLKEPRKKADLEVAKKKKDKDKGMPPRGKVHFAISEKGPHRSFPAARTRVE